MFKKNNIKNSKQKIENKDDKLIKENCIQSLDYLLHQKYRFVTSNSQKYEMSKEVTPCISSLESLPLTKAKSLWLYLKKNLQDEESRTAFGILNSFLESRKYYRYIDNHGNIIRSMVYVYNTYKPIGRLYSLDTSIQRLPKKYRSYLLKDKYFDVNIKNSHPSILYKYALKKGIECSTLESLVKTRCDFYAMIFKELESELGPNLDIKKEIIKCLNKTAIPSPNSTLFLLDQDLIKIRESL
jgi:hypothetical protein